MQPRFARSRKTGSPAPSAGFTIVEVVVVAAVTLFVLASFVVLFRMGQGAFRSGPEVAALRLDASAMVDLMARDLERAGSGLPPEIPVFNDLGRAGNRNPDGLDFLAAPARLAATGFEPVVSFDGTTAGLGVPRSRLDAATRTFVMVFNDDEMMPRWALGEVASVASSGGRQAGAVPHGATQTADGQAATPEGARVGLRPVRNDWHTHFRSLDADTFAPGGGGGLMQRALKSVLGGVIGAVLPGLGTGPAATLTDQVVSAMLKTLAERAGKAGKSIGKDKLPAGGIGEEPAETYGLFGLGQPGIVPVSRIRYWLRPPRPRDAGRRTLMRRVDDGAAQPVGFAEDLQIRYVTGRDAGRLRDTPPPFSGDMRTAAQLGDHIVRSVEVEIRVASSAAASRDGSPTGDGAAPRTTVVQRRVGLRVTAAGVGRRAWEESMQRNALPTEIPRIGPLRFIKLPW